MVFSKIFNFFVQKKKHFDMILPGNKEKETECENK